MEVDSPDDDENHSPCYQRLKLKGKIATVQMRLKTFHDLQATFNTSNPSLMETTSAAAAEQVNWMLWIKIWDGGSLRAIAPATDSDSEDSSIADVGNKLV
ncbi:hypothetical protein TNCV_3075041 [Trichonephila clavipes]|nr:hypothetical protein TNCV_3075041 [Trichonephila clavipes]